MIDDRSVSQYDWIFNRIAQKKSFNKIFEQQHIAHSKNKNFNTAHKISKEGEKKLIKEANIKLWKKQRIKFSLQTSNQPKKVNKYTHHDPNFCTKTIPVHKLSQWKHNKSKH